MKVKRNIEIVKKNAKQLNVNAVKKQNALKKRPTEVETWERKNANVMKKKSTHSHTEHRKVKTNLKLENDFTILRRINITSFEMKKKMK